MGVTESTPQILLIFTFFKHCSPDRWSPPIEYHGHIWKVLPLLGFGDTWQHWPWFAGSNWYLSKIKNFHHVEINEHRFSNRHPCLSASLIENISWNMHRICCCCCCCCYVISLLKIHMIYPIFFRVDSVMDGLVPDCSTSIDNVLQIPVLYYVIWI